YWDRRSAFAVQQTQRNSRSRLANGRWLQDESAGSAVPKTGLLIDHDWPIGDFSDKCERIIGIVACSTTATGQGRKKNCGVVGKCRNPLAQLIHRQAREVDEPHVLVDCQKLILVMTPIRLLLQAIAYHCKLFESRNER